MTPDDIYHELKEKLSDLGFKSAELNNDEVDEALHVIALELGEEN